MIVDNVFNEGREDEFMEESDNSESEDDSSSDVSMSSNNSDDDVEDEEDPTAIGREDRDEEDDELVKAIENSRILHREHPPEIPVHEFVSCICFHPEEDLIALANVEGDILLYKYGNEENTLRSTIEVHERSCRDIKFNAKGDAMISVSKDRSIVVTDVASEKMKRIYENAHDCPINVATIVNENVFATGDDDGGIKLWDLRQRGHSPILSVKENGDYITAMLTNDDGKYLVCASGDGVLTTINVPSKKLHTQSEEYEEFSSLGLFKSNTKLLAAGNSGKMYVFNWGQFGYHSDEFPNLTKKAINCSIPITDNIVITGGEDGLLRAYSLFPHRRLGIVGQHEYSVESLDICNDGTLIASSSHDNVVKFWNIKYFETLNVEEPVKGGKQRQMKHNLPSSKQNNAADFFADLE